MTPEELKGQHGTCPTVKVKTKDGYAVINEHDFDKTKHELFEEPAQQQEAASSEEKRSKKSK